MTNDTQCGWNPGDSCHIVVAVRQAVKYGLTAFRIGSGKPFFLRSPESNRLFENRDPIGVAMGGEAHGDLFGVVFLLGKLWQVALGEIACFRGFDIGLKLSADARAQDEYLANPHRHTVAGCAWPGPSSDAGQWGLTRIIGNRGVNSDETKNG